MSKPVVLQLGEDIRWNHELYEEFKKHFEVRRSYSLNRDDFKEALQSKRFGEFDAMFRPFWNTGGEMGLWNDELILFASAGAGFDWVDTLRLAQSNIIYCNSAAACTESAADSARSMETEQFLSATRTIPAMTHNPAGHILGIIGLGRIGTRVAQKATAAFGMKVIYHDLVHKPLVELSITGGAAFVEKLDDLLAVADCVVLATPYRGTILMDRATFFKMKKGSRFINIARGKLVDEDGLVEALETGHLSAAGLDVHFNEPNVNPKLAGMSNVELQCHIAGGSVESHIGFEKMTMENTLSFFQTGRPMSAINLHLINQKPSYEITPELPLGAVPG